jgi:hypothetical protein
MYMKPYCIHCVLLHNATFSSLNSTQRPSWGKREREVEWREGVRIVAEWSVGERELNNGEWQNGRHGKRWQSAKTISW